MVSIIIAADILVEVTLYSPVRGLATAAERELAVPHGQTGNRRYSDQVVPGTPSWGHSSAATDRNPPDYNWEQTRALGLACSPGDGHSNRHL
jgi:hypothetical protein